MDLTKMALKGVDSIYLAQDRKRQQTLANTVMNLCVSLHERLGIF
jgi:hypothetical protein